LVINYQLLHKLRAQGYVNDTTTTIKHFFLCSLKFKNRSNRRLCRGPNYDKDEPSGAYYTVTLNKHVQRTDNNIR
jgi:hypothetical protein